MAPAVKRMEQTHGLFLIVRGAGFHHRAYQDLKEPAAHRIYHDRDQQTRKRVLKHLRQNGQGYQSCRHKDMGKHHGRPVADPVHKPNGNQVHQQLEDKVNGDQHGDLTQGNPITALKGQEQQRCKIIYNRLYHISGKAGIHCFVISVLHILHNTPFSLFGILHYITISFRYLVFF